jgi:SAM-dependent methyltransferase
VVVGDASSLDFDDGSFDVVLSSFTVFFMPDPTATLRDWRRVLAPGGRIVLSTWAANDPRWNFEREIRRGYIGELDREFLEELRADLDLLERFDDAGKIAAELSAAGFGETASAEHQIEFFFRDEQAWWDWQWSHAARGVLERLSEDARERMRAEVVAAMQQLREERGFPRTYTAIFTRAQAGG